MSVLFLSKTQAKHTDAQESRRRLEHEAFCFEADSADASLVTARRHKLHIAAVIMIESIGECW